MRIAVSLALALPVCGCAIGDHEIAKRCEVDERQLQAAFADVLELAPNGSRKVGRCTLTRSAGKQRVLVTITGQALPQ